MYRILIAGPDGCYPNCPIDVNSETSAFFNSDKAECFSSIDPADLERCDGVVVPGGLPDVGPDLYGEEDTACSIVDKDMDAYQLDLISRAVELRKPIMAFCRGHQLVSVFFGATLIQDIGCKREHCYEPGAPRFHQIKNIPGSFMYELYGAEMKSNSGHHQAIRRLPKCLRVSQLWSDDPEKLEVYAKQAEEGTLCEGSDDCIIEAVYHTDYPFVGLQWHPELGGELLCSHLNLTPLKEYFYCMMEHAAKI